MMYSGDKRQFQSYQGPSDPMLKSSELEGYQPVSRIGEVVVNAFGTPRRALAPAPLPSGPAHTCQSRFFPDQPMLLCIHLPAKQLGPSRLVDSFPARS